MIDPVQLAGMSDDDVASLSQRLGYDPQQVMSDRDNARQVLGVSQGSAQMGPTAEQPPDPYSNPPPGMWDKVKGSLKSGAEAMPVVGPAIAMADMADTAGTQYAARPDSMANQFRADEATKKAGYEAERQKGINALDGVAEASPPPMQAKRQGGPSPGVMGAEITASRDEAEAQRAQIQADLQKQHEMDAMAARQQRDMNTRAAQDALDKEQWGRDYMRHQASADRAMRDVAEMKIDPDRLYKNEDGSTNYAKKIGAALAMALGALGTGNGRPNFALEIVNKALDDDQAAQRANIAKAERGAEKKQEGVKGMYQQHREQLGDDRLARLQAVQDFRQQLQEMASKTTDPQAKARAQSVDAAAEKQQADIKHQFAAENANNTFRNRQLAIEEERAKAAGAGHVPPAVQARVANAQSALRALDAYEAEANKGVLGKIGESGAGKDKQVALESALARMGGSSLSSRNKEIYESMTGGNPADWVSWGRSGRLKALRQTIIDEARTAAAGGGAVGAPAGEGE